MRSAVSRRRGSAVPTLVDDGATSGRLRTISCCPRVELRTSRRQHGDLPYADKGRRRDAGGGGDRALGGGRAVSGGGVVGLDGDSDPAVRRSLGQGPLARHPGPALRHTGTRTTGRTRPGAADDVGPGGEPARWDVPPEGAAAPVGGRGGLRPGRPPGDLPGVRPRDTATGAGDDQWRPSDLRVASGRTAQGILACGRGRARHPPALCRGPARHAAHTRRYGLLGHRRRPARRGRCAGRPCSPS